MSPYSFSGISALGKRSKGWRPLPRCNFFILFFKQLIDFVCFGSSFSSLKAAVLSCTIPDAPCHPCSAPGQRTEQLRALLGHVNPIVIWSSSCHHFGFPKRNVVFWLTYVVLLSGSVWEVQKFYWDFCGWCAIMFDFGIPGSVLSFCVLVFFSCHVVWGLVCCFGVVFFHSGNGKMLKKPAKMQCKSYPLV